MMTVAWVIVLGLLILYFSNWESNRYNPNQKPNSQQNDSANIVRLQRNRHHHYITNGTINQQPVTFLLDTGATDVVIAENLAAQLNLKKGADQFAITANGTIKVYRTMIPELRIGSITLTNIRASINPAMRDTEILLGMSALKDIEFTQRGEQLTLKQYR